MRRLVTAALAVAGSLLCASGARADEVKVMTSGAFIAALRELTPAFEKTTCKHDRGR